jgi:hypothetical protein
VITENDICNELLAHWKEQDKPHLDDEDKCCYALAVRAADEIRRLRAEVEALRAGNARRDIELSIIETILTDGCNVDPTPIDMEYWSTTHDRLMEIMREVEALRGVHEAATRVFKFYAVNKRNFFMAFRDLESNLDRVAEIDAARKGE